MPKTLGIWEWGCPKRGDAQNAVTAESKVKCGSKQPNQPKGRWRWKKKHENVKLKEEDVPRAILPREKLEECTVKQLMNRTQVLNTVETVVSETLNLCAKSFWNKSKSHLACKAGVFWSTIHELFSGMAFSRYLRVTINVPPSFR